MMTKINLSRFFYVCTTCGEFTYSNEPHPIACRDDCYTAAMEAAKCYARTARANRLKLPEEFLQRYDALRILPGLAEGARFGAMSFDEANDKLSLAVCQALLKSANGQTDPSDVFWWQ